MKKAKDGGGGRALNPGFVWDTRADSEKESAQAPWDFSGALLCEAAAASCTSIWFMGVHNMGLHNTIVCLTSGAATDVAREHKERGTTTLDAKIKEALKTKVCALKTSNEAEGGGEDRRGSTATRRRARAHSDATGAAEMSGGVAGPGQCAPVVQQLTVPASYGYISLNRTLAFLDL